MLILPYTEESGRVLAIPGRDNSMTVASKDSTKTAEPVKMAFDFLDLKAQYATIRADVMAAITRVMDSQHFILGPEVKLLEDELAARLGAKHAIGWASGT